MAAGIKFSSLKIEGRGEVVLVGEPLTGFNAPEFIPVKFDDGTFGILSLPGASIFEWVGEESDELNNAIKFSSKMPQIETLATGIIRIYVVNKDGRAGCIRYHYGFGKEDREDYLTWEPK